MAFRRSYMWLMLALCSAGAAGCQTAQQKLTQQGITQFNAAQYPAAESTFNQVLSKDQFNAQAHYYAGVAAMHEEKYEVAAYHLKLAWQADPSMSDAKDALTETLIRQGHPDWALDFLDRDAALTASTRDPRAMKVINKHRYTWEKEERMYLHKADDRARVAMIYEKLGDLDNAGLNYDRAVEIAPKDPDVLVAAGKFFARVGKRDKSADLFTKAYNIDPKTPGLADAINKNRMVVR